MYSFEEHTRQTSAASVSTENPVTRSATSCDVGCKLSADGTTCVCSTTCSGISCLSIRYTLRIISGVFSHPTVTVVPLQTIPTYFIHGDEAIYPPEGIYRPKV